MHKIFSLLLSSAVFSPLIADELYVYTYDSFASEWGPGPAIEAAFEEICDCDLIYTTAADAGIILARLRLEGENSHADVILGLDQNILAKDVEESLLLPHEMNDEPIHGSGLVWSNEYTRAFDWGHFAWIYNQDNLTKPPSSFDELAKSDLKVIIQDPRASSPGLGLVLWVYDQYQEQAESFWQEFADNILTVTPSWDDAYALFLEGQADMVLSYSTSPAYHRIAEADERYVFANFPDGHGLQIELAGILASSQNPEMAMQFLQFLESDEAQSIIHQGNWMYPTGDIEIAEGFDNPNIVNAIDSEHSKEEIEKALAAFDNGLK